MLALDQLLKANELNFQALALVPSLLVIGGGMKYLYDRIYKRSKQKSIYLKIRQELRVVERLLNLNIPDYRESKKEKVSPLDISLESVGRLLLSISSLKIYSSSLKSKERSLFIEDLYDLESEEHNVLRRLGTVHRMYHTYPFVLLKA